MLLRLVQSVNASLSDYVLMVLLIGVGLWYSVQTNFVQVHCFRESLRRLSGILSFHGTAQGDGMTSFQAFSTAFAAQIGAGNIVGAGSAILLGGPGAIFWMWVIAFFGMATIYAESVLAVQTRQKARDGRYQGGALQYIAAAFPGASGEKIAAFFAFAAVLALGFSGSMAQSNAIGAAFRTAFGIPPWFTGLLLVGLCAAVFSGVAQPLAPFMEKSVPVMTAVFLFGGAVVLLARIAYLPATLWMIVKYAFVPKAIIGGGFGAALKTAVSQGAKRGLFSNEAGLGSTSHAHAQANVDKPHEQGMMAMMGVFIDTFIVLTCNALVIISTLYTKGAPLEYGYTGAAVQTLDPANLSQMAFGSVFRGGFGAAFVAVCLFFFAFSTLLSWNFCGRIHMVYLFGRDSGNAYTAASLIFIFLGTVTSNALVWELADMFNQWMVIPNVMALIALTGLTLKSR